MLLKIDLYLNSFKKNCFLLIFSVGVNYNEKNIFQLAKKYKFL